MVTKKAIILAAGKGERLVRGKPYPKPLKSIGGLPIIVRVLRNMELAGIEEVGIVVGHLADVLIDGLSKHRFQLKLRFIENDEFEKPNGTSLLKAADFVDGPTILSMSDHLWGVDLLRTVMEAPFADDMAVLGVDFKITQCFDLDDATKVGLNGSAIVSIGKELSEYDALDTGVFRIGPALIEALREADDPQQGCSLSQGVQLLSARQQMRVVDVGDACWVDVDTPEAHAFAELRLSDYGQRTMVRVTHRIGDISRELYPV